MYELAEPRQSLIVGHATPARDDARRRLPTYEQLRTIKTGLEVFILLLAIPWLLSELIRNPSALTKKIAGHHMG